MATEQSPFGPYLAWLMQMFSPQRFGLMLGLAAVAAAVFGMWLWTHTPDYRVLYANLSDRDGGAVVAALQQMNVPYQHAEGGSAILVPADKVHDSRLRLAGQGLPKGSLVGFELMESARIGTSQFMEQVNYQRALEGELARSIQSLAAVNAARVHLAFSRPSVFVREQQKPSASVVLSLRAGRTLDPPQVMAIAHLIASSVPDLPVKRVTVLDQTGNLLSSPDGGSQPLLDPGQLKYVQELESSYAKRIEAILTPLLGAANVRAQVTADVDFSVIERAEEVFKPNQDPVNAALRSQQTSESPAPGAGAAGGGVPGALSNQPPVAASAPIPATAAPAPGQAQPGIAATRAPGTAGAPATASAPVRKDATVNYEVDRTIRHVRQPVGTLRRISAAVVVNPRKPPAAAAKKGAAKPAPVVEENIPQITALIKEAIGFSETRGDTLNVVSRAFSEPDPVVEPAPTPAWKDPQVIGMAKTAGQYLLFALLAGYLFVAVLRPMFRALMTPPPAPPQLAGAAAPPGMGPRSYEGNLQAARQVAQQEPRLMANVVKNWVGGNE